MPSFRQHLRLLQVDVATDIEITKTIISEFSIPVEIIKYSIAPIFDATTIGHDQVLSDHLNLGLSLAANPSIGHKITGTFDFSSFLSAQVQIGHYLKQKSCVHFYQVSDFAQGHTLSHRNCFGVEALAHPSVGAVLSSKTNLDISTHLSFTTDIGLDGYATFHTYLKPDITVAHALQQYHETLNEFVIVDPIFGHALSTKFGLQESAQLSPSIGTTLTQTTKLAFKTKATVSVASLLRHGQILLIEGHFPLRVATSLKTPFSITWYFTTNIRQNHTMSSQYMTIFSYKSYLGISASLSQTQSLGIKFKSALIQGHFEKTNYKIGFAFNAGQLVVSNPIKTNLQIVVTLKNLLKVVSSQKLTTVLSATLRASFTQADILRSRQSLLLSSRFSDSQNHLLVSKITLPLTIKISMATPNSYEAETYALLNRMNPIPNTVARRERINTYIKNLKTAGIWVKLDYLYILAADVAANALLNWVSTKYSLTVVGTPVFTAKKGYTFAAANSYLETGFIPGNNTLFSQNDAHASVRVLNSVSSTIQDIGNSSTYITSRSTLSNLAFALNSGVSLNLLNTAAGANLFLINRTDANGIDYYTLTTGPTTVLNPSADTTQTAFSIGGRTAASGRQIAFASAGMSLTQNQAATLISETESLLTAFAA